MRPIAKTLLWLTLFSIAMGYLESAVVVYLRELYYPNGFTFPLAPIKPSVAITEFWREAATIFMLAGVGILAGKNALQRFAFFVFSFGIWDIFYYVFLKVLVAWPESLFTWDILFIIPVPWVGPVLAPCLVSLTMIGFMCFVIVAEEKDYRLRLPMPQISVMALGCSLILLSFVWDYLAYVHATLGLSALWTLSSQDSLFREASQYVPAQFYWWLFGLGEGILLLGIYWFAHRTLQTEPVSVQTPHSFLKSDGANSRSSRRSVPTTAESFSDYLNGL